MSSSNPINIQQNVPLGPLTTLKVGGPARFFVRADSDDQVVEAFEYARRHDLPVFVLGGGSNVLISDAGFDGLVIQPAIIGVEILPGEANTDLSFIDVGAGEDWDTFVQLSVSEGLAGLECLSGIPGFVGGTPVQNVGAYGQDVSESIVRVRCYDRERGDLVEMTNSDCQFAYRTSIFNSIHRDRFVVLYVAYELRKNGPPKIEYKDLIEYFGGRQPSLAEARDAVLKIRRSKSMVIDPDDPNSRSAGSFFKNPVIAKSHYEIIRAAFDADIPYFHAGDMLKIPAAWLIERAGFHKGYRLGNAGISTNHSLALVNLGGASADEIIALKEKIQDGVQQKFDILLQPEPVLVGFE